MGVFRTRFLTPQGEKNLAAYKYVGSDSSLLYKYFFSPCAQFLVDHVIPPWLAPNVITLCGFACTLIPHLILLIGYSPDMGGYVPQWFCFIAALGQLAYMILDNADGKQARKTGSSSPLGLLFDHGCDAMNTFVSGLTLFRVLQFGNTAAVIYAFMITMNTFYMATWEEYYVNALNLPIINGANEGIAFAILMYLITGILGCQIWTQQIGILAANEIVLVAFAAMAFMTIMSNLINVYRHDKSIFPKALFNLIILCYMNITLLIIMYVSYTNIVSRSARVVIYFVGFSFAKLVGHLQASHVAHENFQQFRKSMIFSFTLLNVHTIIGALTESPLFNEEDLVFGLFLYALLVYIHFVLNVVTQFSKALGIYVFKIGRREDIDDLMKFSEEVDYSTSRLSI